MQKCKLVSSYIKRTKNVCGYVYRDPYMLDFLGLKDTYSEKDLENAILAIANAKEQLGQRESAE